MNLVMPDDATQRARLVAKVERLYSFAISRGAKFSEGVGPTVLGAREELAKEDAAAAFARFLDAFREIVEKLGDDGQKELARIESELHALDSEKEIPIRYLYGFAILVIALLAFLTTLVNFQISLVDRGKTTIIQSKRINVDYTLLKDKPRSSEEEQRFLQIQEELAQLRGEAYALGENLCEHSQQFIVRLFAGGGGFPCTEEEVGKRGLAALGIIGEKFLLLSNFVLPIAYGFLGALVLVVRSRLGAIGLSGTGFRGSRAVLRLMLGALCGLAIGWFLQPLAQAAPVLGADGKPIANGFQWSVAPFALAFLAGYSVEAVFSVLDRLSAAIAGPAR